MQGTSQYNPRTSLYCSSKEYRLAEEILQKFESEETELELKDFFSNKNPSSKSYVRKIHRYSIAAFLEGDYRYRNIAKCLNFTAKNRFPDFCECDAIIEKVTYCFTQCGNFNLKWKRKAVKFIADLERPSLLKTIVERDLSKRKPELPRDVHAKLMAIDQDSVPVCYSLVTILLCLKAKNRIREKRSLYHDGNDCLKKYLHTEDELSDIGTLVQRIAKKGVARELILRYMHLAFFGDVRYLKVALGLNSNNKKIPELRRAKKIFKDGINREWKELALLYIEYLEKRDCSSSASFVLIEKVNLAILHKHPAFISFESHVEVRNKLLCMDIDSVFECYNLVIALNDLKNKYRFVDLGGYEVSEQEYKPFLAPIVLRSFKEELDEDESVSENALQRIKQLFNVEIMPGKIESLNDFLQIKTLEHINYQFNIAIATGQIVFWNNANNLIAEGKRFWGNNFGEEVRNEMEEIHELFKSRKYNQHWKQDALAYIERYSSGTQVEGMSIVRSATNAAIKESRLPQFNGPEEYTHRSVRNYLIVTTLNSVYSRYKTVEEIRSLISSQNPSSSEKGSVIDRWRSTFVNKIEKFFLKIDKFFEDIRKWPIPPDLVLNPPFYRDNTSWEKYVDKHGAGLSKKMDLMLLAALATFDSRWLELYKQIIEFYPKLGNQELCRDVEKIFEEGIKEWQFKDYANNLSSFLEHPMVSSPFKKKLEKEFGYDKFMEMKNLLESTKLEDMLKKYRLAERLNEICRDSLIRRNSKDQGSSSADLSSKGKEVETYDESDSFGSSVIVHSESSLSSIRVMELETDIELITSICSHDNSLARLAAYFMVNNMFMSGKEIKEDFERYKDLVAALKKMNDFIGLINSFAEDNSTISSDLPQNEIRRDSLIRRNSNDQRNSYPASSPKGKEAVSDESDSSCGSSVIVRSESSFSSIGIAELEISIDLIAKICSHDNSLARLAAYFMANNMFMSGKEIKEDFERYKDLAAALKKMSEFIGLLNNFVEDNPNVISSFTNNSKDN